MTKPRLPAPPSAGPRLARPLVQGPRAEGIAERGMAYAVTIRLAQLVTLARLAEEERAIERQVEVRTDGTRKPSDTPPPEPPSHEAALVAAGVFVGDVVGGSIVRYVREYDADDHDEAVRQDCALFLEGLIRGILQTRLPFRQTTGHVSRP